MDGWLWLVVALFCAAVETQLAGTLVALFFAVGAVAAAAATQARLTPLLWQQALVFGGVSAASMVALRRRLWRLRPPAWPEDLDSLVGQEATALGGLSPGGLGQVELRGVPWQARSAAAQAISAGARCRVVGVSGLTLDVELAAPGGPARAGQKQSQGGNE